MSQKLGKKNFKLYQVFMFLNCFKYFLIYILGQILRKNLEMTTFELYEVLILSNRIETKSFTQ